MKRRRENNQQRAVLSNFLSKKTGGAYRQQCPLCQLFFSSERIETHAATCGVDDPFPASVTQSQSSQNLQQSDVLDGPASTSCSVAPSPQSTHTISVSPPVHAPTPPASVKSNTNSASSSAFTLLMAAQVEAREKETREKTRSTFRLDCVDGRLVPSWSLDTEPSHEPQNSCTVWKEEVTFRDVLTDLSPDPQYIHATSNATNGPERSVMRVLVATNIDPQQGSSVEEGGITSGRIAPSLLKSMMQKAIRRGKSVEALRLSVALADLSLMELLRRLPVIILEDVSLHPELPVLIWLMVAVSRGYNPTNGLIYTVLGIVLDLCCTSNRDVYESISDHALEMHTLSIKNTPSKGTRDISSQESGHEETPSCAHTRNDDDQVKSLKLHSLPLGAPRLLVVSLLFRAAYGGLRGDVRMLEEYARLWAVRFYCTKGASADDSAYMTSSRTDFMLIPTLKYSLHHGFLTEIANIGQWGMNLVLSFVKSSSLPERRALHTKACSCLPHGDISRSPESGTTLENTTYVQQENILNLENGRNIHPMRLIYKEYPLRMSDLVPEGFDFHCEPALVQYVLNAIGGADVILQAKSKGEVMTTENSTPSERLDHAIEILHQVVWYFRSSNNVRTIWNLHITTSTSSSSSLLNIKKQLAKVWSLIAKPISRYSEGRLVEVAQRLKLPILKPLT